MHRRYEVIKLPHHGTDSYYHSFVGIVDSNSTFMIPNGYIKKRWYISSKYNNDCVKVGNTTVCAYNNGCLTPVCPRCTCIFPNLYLDI